MKWIDVNDQRPPSQGYYLVACEGGNVDKTFYCEYLPYFENNAMNWSRPTRKHCGKWSKYFELSWKYGYRITHWAIMPIHPKKQAEG